jgi:hypothetical protein
LPSGIAADAMSRVEDREQGFWSGRQLVGIAEPGRTGDGQVIDVVLLARVPPRSAGNLGVSAVVRAAVESAGGGDAD